MSSAPGHSVVPPPRLPPPPPGDPSDLDPLLETLPAGTTFHRCYDANYGSREFYAGTKAPRGRFHPTDSSAATPVATTVPVLYGASDLTGALSETIFHDIPVLGIKQVPHAKLIHRLAVQLETGRDLRLIDLTSAGLSRLGVSRPQLIESDPRA